MKRDAILAVHHSAELYGADRSFFDAIVGLKDCAEVTVLLPETGPLVEHLKGAGIPVVVGPVGKLRSDMLSIRGVASGCLDVMRSVAFMRRLTKGARPNAVYSNTVAILGGALFAWVARIPHVWHVREIPGRPRFASLALSALVRSMSRIVIANSAATGAWVRGAHMGKSTEVTVIHNGLTIDIEGLRDSRALRRDFGFDDDDVIFVVVGRLNRWKGQVLFLRALASARLTGAGRAAGLIVGSPYRGQERYRDAIQQEITARGLESCVRMIEFQDDVRPCFAVADVVVVPSEEPEPFGRVAVEAMAFGKPVIAAAHGGLVEIVRGEVTGALFPPRDEAGLAREMCRLHDDPILRRRWGETGLAVQKRSFSVDSYRSQIQGVFRGLQGE